MLLAEVRPGLGDGGVSHGRRVWFGVRDGGVVSGWCAGVCLVGVIGCTICDSVAWCQF